MAAPRQPVERGPAQHRAADPHPRVLEPALARLVCSRAGYPYPALGMVQSPYIPGPEVVRPLGVKSCIRGTGLAEPGRCSRAGTPPHRPEHPVRGFLYRDAVCFFWGFFAFDLWSTIFGMALVYCGKLWFLDRMVWLWEDMKDTNEEYRGWGRVP